ncbi:hypothetical protein HK102_003345, partial [Quaeritorhiza haematococci]
MTEPNVTYPATPQEESDDAATAVPMETDHPASTPATTTATPDDGEVKQEPQPTIDNLLPPIEYEIVDTFIYRWHIPSWSQMRQQDKTHSPEFTCGGFRWRVLLFPNGNRQNDTLSVFLESVDAANLDKKAKWHVCVQFAIAVANPEDETVVKSSHANHRYNPNETDWGFNHLVKIVALYQPTEGFPRPLVENDRTDIIVYMRVIKDPTGVLWHNFQEYDSKKETGYVGLKNQGATCYMNSLLQSLYFTTYFRKATFAIPTENDEPTKSIPLALQRVFYQLQTSDAPVGTTELTKSFGWDTLDSFMQHDVQEFNRVLQDNLESKMKGTKAEGAISKLFVGKMKSYIKCINVDFESSRVEDYYDIQLNVKGCKTLRDSFVNYVQVETLEGENKYMAEGYGLQDAKKGVIFKTFPPVLHLQLKRFEYDIQRDAMVKINDRHEFPLEIDLDEFLDADSDKSVPQRYHLHGVLVHSGDLHGGHYCAFIRTTPKGKWFKFDDDRVIPVTDKEVFEDNFGGEYPQRPSQTGVLNNSTPPQNGAQVKTYKRFTNAYMLVYVREADLDDVLAPMSEEDIPEHMRLRLEEEKALSEQRRREKEEAHMYMQVKLLTDDLVRQHDGFDLCNFEDKQNPLTQLHTYKVKKEDTYLSFKERISKEFNVPVEKFRLWTMVGRQNKTIRPDFPIPETEGDKPIEFIRDRFAKQMPELRFYMEKPDSDRPNTALKGGYFLEKAEGVPTAHIVIFLKYYDPKIRKLEFVGKVTIKNKMQKISDLIPFLLEKKGFPPNTALQLYEEVKPTMIDLLKPKMNFHQAEISDGDIICFQKELSPAEIEELPEPSLATIPQYFESILNRVTVTFKHKVPKDREKETQPQPQPDFDLVLSKKMGYDAVAQKLAEKIGADPNKLRFSSGAPNSAKTIIKRSDKVTLQEMLPSFYTTHSNTLWYEILEVPLTELEVKRYMKVSFLDRHLKEQGPHDVLVMKTGTVADLIEAVLGKVKLEQQEGGSGKFRVFEVIMGKIHRVYAEDASVSTIAEHTTLYMEEIPTEEVQMTETDKIVPVFHFTKEPNRVHSAPFTFVLHHGEMFSETKKRLQARLGMNDKDFGKVKFAWVPHTGAKWRYLEDDDIVADLEIGPQDYLGLDHVDKSGRNGRLGTFEKAIKIF